MTLVIGAGSGIGSAVARRFATGGYTVCVVRRSDKEKLEALAARINDEATNGQGGQAHAFMCDCTKEEEVVSLVSKIEKDIGPIEVVVYNLGANMGSRDLQSTSWKVFERAWRLGSAGAFFVARSATPAMVERGKGSFIFTGATASLRGNSDQHAHTMAMQGRRALAQSMSAELWSKGIHVCHCIVDGLVDAPDTIGRMMPEVFKQMKAELEPRDGIVKPDDVAEHYWHMHSQPRNCWTFETDLRPWQDRAWFNSK